MIKNSKHLVLNQQNMEYNDFLDFLLINHIDLKNNDRYLFNEKVGFFNYIKNIKNNEEKSFNIIFEPILIYYTIYLIKNKKEREIIEFSSFIKLNMINTYTDTFYNQINKLYINKEEKKKHLHYILLSNSIYFDFYTFLTNISDLTSFPLVKTPPIITDFIFSNKSLIDYINISFLFNKDIKLDVFELLFELDLNYWNCCLNTFSEKIGTEVLFSNFFSFNAKCFFREVILKDDNNEGLLFIINYYKNNFKKLSKTDVYSNIKIKNELIAIFEDKINIEDLTYFVFLGFFLKGRNKYTIYKKELIFNEIIILFQNFIKNIEEKFIVFLLNDISLAIEHDNININIFINNLKENHFILNNELENKILNKKIIFVNKIKNEITIPPVLNNDDLNDFKFSIVKSYENLSLFNSNHSILFNKIKVDISNLTNNKMISDNDIIQFLKFIENLDAEFFDKETIQIEVDKISLSKIENIWS